MGDVEEASLGGELCIYYSIINLQETEANGETAQKVVGEGNKDKHGDKSK